ncbi:hypothetical protein ACTA71_004330 [Dictyostelium dimigraforme]
MPQLPINIPTRDHVIDSDYSSQCSGKTHLYINFFTLVIQIIKITFLHLFQLLISVIIYSPSISEPFFTKIKMQQLYLDFNFSFKYFSICFWNVNLEHDINWLAFS